MGSKQVIELQEPESNGNKILLHIIQNTEIIYFCAYLTQKYEIRCMI